MKRAPADIAALAARLKADLTPAEVAALARALSQPDIAKTTRAAPAARPDTLIADITALFQPLLARAEEKAGLLVDALAAAGFPVGEVQVRGFAPTLRRLRAIAPDQAIRAAAETVMAQARAFGSLRETVV